MVELLVSEPEVLSLELLRRAKLKGYRGSKSALYALAIGTPNSQCRAKG